MSMTFLQLQNELITAGTQRFSETQRTSVKYWLNLRGAQLWNSQPWVFRNGSASVTVTSGSSAVTSLPTDFDGACSLFRADGYELNWLQYSDFQNLYYGQTATGPPVDFAILNGAISVGPISSETSSAYRLVYQKAWTDMVADADVPALPAQHHYLLVNGAMAHGLAMENDFTSDFHESLWQQGMQAMIADYLIDEDGDNDQYGRDALASGWY